jgi:hypothetical protein
VHLLRLFGDRILNNNHSIITFDAASYGE